MKTYEVGYKVTFYDTVRIEARGRGRNCAAVGITSRRLFELPNNPKRRRSGVHP